MEIPETLLEIRRPGLLRLKPQPDNPNPLKRVTAARVAAAGWKPAADMASVPRHIDLMCPQPL